MTPRAKKIKNSQIFKKREKIVQKSINLRVFGKGLFVSSWKRVCVCVCVCVCVGGGGRADGRGQ